MAMAKLVFLVALVAAAASSCSAWRPNILMPTTHAVEAAAERLQENVAAPVIHALRPLLASGGHLGRVANIPCDSWRLAVEAYNKRDWRRCPRSASAT
jgi:hypothetical protein